MAELMNTKKILIYVTVFGTAVFLLVSLARGAQTGKAQAQAEVTASNAHSLTAAFQSFYQDQDRFPSAVEFSEPNIMRNYLSAFPPVEFTSSACASAFIYTRD